MASSYNNKYITKVNSTILSSKIEQLAQKLKDASQGSTAQTKEELTREATKFLSTFFQNLSKPLYNPRPVFSGHKPELSVHRNNFQDILSDFLILFSELENMETILISNFNFTTSAINRLIGKVKGVRSKLDDFILYSSEPNKDFIYVSDSFNNLSRIDFNTKLLNNTQAEVDQIQGVVTLPIDTEKNVSINITIQPTINSNSNGVAGNNWEANAALNSDINNIIDNNSDTWFEYEHVVNRVSQDDEALLLDIVLNLDSPKIVNYIRINPNNFGAKNPVSIETIETSIDGKTYINIKDDIPINGFVPQDDENIFLLAPSTSKFAGQGIYTFSARKAKYIHLVFKQASAYSIITSTGSTKYRYAIGIRDIEVASKPYIESGELISSIYTFEEEIRKLILITNQNPVEESELASIDHFISPDDGLSWWPIRPRDFVSTTSPILNFNTLDKDSINTKSPVNSIRYKAVLRRNTNGFTNSSSSLKKIVESKMELHTITDTAPFEIALGTTPVPSTVNLLDPMYGSRGIDTSRLLTYTGNGSALSIYIPFTNIQMDYTKTLSSGAYYLTEVGPEEIRINGELWSRGNLSVAGSTDKVYALDYTTGLLRFGNSTNGKAVQDGSTIDVKFSSERLYPSADNNHLIQLQFPTSFDKQQMTIKRYDAETLATDVLNKGATTHRLQYNHLVSTSTIVFSDTVVFATPQTYIDGQSELSTAGDYSIDYTNGIIYSYTRTSTSTTTSVTYVYQPITIIDTNQWDFIINEDGTSFISLNHSDFATITISSESIPTSVHYFNTSNLSITKDTLRFNGTNAAAIFAKEVPFIDGRTELSTAIKTTEKLSSISGSGNHNIDLRMTIINDSNYEVQFTDTTTFATRVGSSGAVNSAGKYFIDRPNNRVIVNTSSSVSNPGYIDYYYTDATKVATGIYSVNYKTGEIYCASTTTSGLTMDYQYSHYVGEYYISRKVPSTDFSLEGNIITINEREVLRRKEIKKQTDTPYQVAFSSIVENREDINELAPFFTPVLKDYAIKVVPDSVLSIKDI